MYVCMHACMDVCMHGQNRETEKREQLGIEAFLRLLCADSPCPQAYLRSAAVLARSVKKQEQKEGALCVCRCRDRAKDGSTVHSCIPRVSPETKRFRSV
jgi:hypothetical protein